LDVTLVGDGHSTTDSGALSAKQIIKHHNETLHGHYNVEHFSVVRNAVEDLFHPIHDSYRLNIYQCNFIVLFEGMVQYLFKLIQLFGLAPFTPKLSASCTKSGFPNAVPKLLLNFSCIICSSNFNVESFNTMMINDRPSRLAVSNSEIFYPVH